MFESFEIDKLQKKVDILDREIKSYGESLTFILKYLSRNANSYDEKKLFGQLNRKMKEFQDETERLKTKLNKRKPFDNHDDSDPFGKGDYE